MTEPNYEIDYNEKKNIGTFSCKKATTKFRGRTYNAWYCADIPTFFGPWKFNGLPGLILEISDESKSFSWICKQVEIPSKNIIDIPYKNFETISIVDYIEERKKNLEKIRARVRGVLPRGVEFKSPKNYRKGLELIFEWEKDE